MGWVVRLISYAFSGLRDGDDSSSIRGFKELVVPTGMAAEAAKGDAKHLSAGSASDLVDFLWRLFPCAQVLLSFRRNTSAQVSGDFFVRHNTSADDVGAIGAGMQNFAASLDKDRAHAIALEDFSIKSFTAIAAWLGFGNCSFISIPEANSASSFNSSSGHFPQYHPDYSGAKVQCEASNLSDSPLGAETSRDVSPVLDVSAFDHHGGHAANPSVYVLDIPRELNSDLVACYYQDTGLSPWDDTGSTFDAVDVAQHSADIWLHQALLKLPQGGSADDADIIWVPFYSLLSRRMGMYNSTCNNVTHEERLHMLFNTLNTSLTWKRGPHHVLPLTHWLLGDQLQPDAWLKSLILSSGIKLVINDPLFLYQPTPVTGIGNLGYSTCHAVTVPYIPLLGLLSPSDGPSLRRTIIFFRGNTLLASCKKELEGTVPFLGNKCNLRRRMISAIRPAADVSVLPIDSSIGSPGNTQRAEPFSTNAAALGFRDSTFCLVPPGDTCSSRRMFDAIAGGCIPVVISGCPYQYLPFVEQGLNYSAFTIQLEESAVEHIETILRETPTAMIRELQFNLRLARDVLLFGDEPPNSVNYTPGIATKLTLRAISRAIYSADCRSHLGSPARSRSHV